MTRIALSLIFRIRNVVVLMAKIAKNIFLGYGLLILGFAYAGDRLASAAPIYMVPLATALAIHIAIIIVDRLLVAASRHVHLKT